MSVSVIPLRDLETSFVRLSSKLYKMDEALAKLDNYSRRSTPNVEKKAELLRKLSLIRQDLLQELPRFRQMVEGTGPLLAGLIQDVEAGVQRLEFVA